jgi:hypothetical protein
MPKLIITVNYDDFDRDAYTEDAEGNKLSKEQQEALTELDMLKLDVAYVRTGQMPLQELLDYGDVDLEDDLKVEE